MQLLTEFGEANKRQIIGSLMTNADGVVIFDNAGLAGAVARQWPIFVSFGGREEQTYPVAPDMIGVTRGLIPFDLEEMEEALAGLNPLPAAPWTEVGLGADDLWTSPSTFPDLGDLVFGDDQCTRLIPNDQTLRVFEQSHVVMTERNVLTCRAADPENPEEFEQITLHRGEVLSHEITWRRLGYTFGDLLYSLTLGPGETTTMAISTWEQRQRVEAARAGETGERATGRASRASSLSETMNAAGRQFAIGTTSGFTTSASVGAQFSSALNGSLGLARAVGVTTNFSQGSFSANAARDFADEIQQHAEVLRRDHQTLVAEQTESEDQSVSTRAICNKNWSRVLNIFYHEVLENHRVTTRMKGTQEVYFVPHTVEDFDLERAFCTQALLEPYLLQPELAECYEAVSRLLFDPRVMDELADEENSGEAEDDIGDSSIAPTTSSFRVKLDIGNNGLAEKRPVKLVIGVSSGQELTFPIIRSGRWQRKSSYSHIVSTSAIEPATIEYIGFRNDSIYAVTIASYSVSFLDPNGTGWILIGTYAPGNVKGGSKSTNSFNVNWTPSQSEDDETVIDDIPADATLEGKPTAEDYQHCAEALVAHLNCHAFYYNSLLWLLRDRNERYHWLETFNCSPEGPLCDLIDPEPIALLGHYVAFASTQSEFVDDPDRPVLDDRLVTLPTSGVFADAALGQCSAREELPPAEDPFWLWVDKPNTCEGAAPALASPQANSLLGPNGLAFLASPSGGLATAPSINVGEQIVNSLATTLGSGLAEHLLSHADNADLNALLASLSDLLGEAADAPGETSGSETANDETSDSEQSESGG